MIKHYYHIYSDGQWTEPVKEHLDALRKSGLEDRLDFFGVGIVGSVYSRNRVKDLFKSMGVKFEVVVESTVGWEQLTLDSIVCSAGDKVLYCHTKGAANPSDHSDNWRCSMTEGVVNRWERAVELLDEYDAVGSHWLEISNIGRHWSGNFWWATGAYLNTLPHPVLANTRWDAESWMGGGRGLMYDLAAGSATGGNWLYQEDPGQDGVPDGCVRFIVNNSIAGLNKGTVHVRVLDDGISMCIKEGHLQVLGKRVERVYDYRI